MPVRTERQDSWIRGASLDARVEDARLAAKLEHCRVEADGSVMARNGTIRCTSSPIASDTPYGLRMYRDASGTRRFVALIGTSAYLSSSTAAGPWTELETGLTAAYADFTEFNYGVSNYMLWANGTDFLAFDGATVDPLANAPSGAFFIRAFNDRVYAGVQGTNRVYASKVRNLSVWSVADGGISLQIGGAGPITGMEVAGSHLLVFKSHETEKVSGFGESTLVVAAGPVGVSRSVGCVCFRTIQVCGDAGVAWLSQRGIEFYSPASGVAECVSRELDAFFHPLPASITAVPYAAAPECFSFGSYESTHSFYDGRRGEYHLFMADSLGAQAEVVFVPTTGACYLWPTNALPVTASASTYVYSAPPAGTVAPSFWRLATGGTYLYPSSEGMLADFRFSASDLLIPSDDELLTAAVETFVSMPSPMLALTDGAELEPGEFVPPGDFYPMTIATDGYPMLREYGSTDLQGFTGSAGFQVIGIVRTRPMVFGVPNREKRARVVRASMRNITASTQEALIRTGSEQIGGINHTVSLTAAQSKTFAVLVSVRGTVPYGEVTLSPGVALDAVEVDAEIYQRGGVR